MRKKIISKAEEERKRRKKQKWLGIALIIIMFGSVFGVVVSFFGSSNYGGNDGSHYAIEDYKGYKVLQEGGFYIINTGIQNIYLGSNPHNLEFIDYTVEIAHIFQSYIGQSLYIDAKDPYISQQIQQNLFNYPDTISFACIDELDCENDNLPLKTCEDNMIIIRDATENSIRQEENCIYIHAKPEDTSRMVDVLLLELFGIH